MQGRGGRRRGRRSGRHSLHRGAPCTLKRIRDIASLKRIKEEDVEEVVVEGEERREGRKKGSEEKMSYLAWWSSIMWLLAIFLHQSIELSHDFFLLQKERALVRTKKEERKKGSLLW